MFSLVNLRQRWIGAAAQCLVALGIVTASEAAGAAQVWFAPIDDITRLANASYGIIPAEYEGATDYLLLFQAGSDWPRAMGKVAVFKMYIHPIGGNQFGRYTDSQLQQIFSFLNSKGIALALEFGPLTASAGCGAGIEGFNGPGAQAIIDRIKSNGGVLKYIALDEPFFYANIYDGTQACHWTALQIAQNAQPSLSLFRSAFPGVQIGDIEPAPGTGAADWVHRYAEWMDAWKSVTGQPLAFFHADTGFAATWLDDVASLKAELSKRAVPLGVIYDGYVGDRTDAAWLSHAEDMYTQQELNLGIPEQAIFQSWHAFPRTALPEGTPSTFTWLINRYQRPRTSLRLSATTRSATGRLLNAAGDGVAGAAIAVTARPLSGLGLTATYELSGTVPTLNSKALIQMCINGCGAVRKDLDVTFYSFDYADAQTRAHRDFSNGLTGWGRNVNSAATLQAGVDSDGSYLRAVATAAQDTFVNSSSFAVTPGSPYTLKIRARIPPGSAGSGTFALIFVVTSETSRDQLPFAPGTLQLATATTSSDGSFLVPVSAQVSGDVQVRASFAGSDDLWPALATGPLAPASGPPAAPLGLIFSIQDDVVSLAWTSSLLGGAPSSYVVLARAAPGGPVIASVPVTVGTGLTVTAPIGTYIVSVRASNAEGSSAESQPVTLRVGTPGPPQGLAASVAGKVVTMSWTAPSSGSPPSAYSIIARLVPGGPVLATLAAGTSTSLSVPAPSGVYIVSVLAENVFGQGAESAPITVRVP